MDLRAIALRQRAVICCILAFIVVALSGLAIPEGGHATVIVQGVLLLAFMVAGVIFALMLSVAVYRNPATGVIGGILMFFPLFGLLVLVVINIDAVKILPAATASASGCWG